MVLIKFFLKKFLVTFLVITITLAFLFNLIELFDKLIRVSESTIQTALTFSFLHFLPSFSELMPVASWLAALFILREWHIKNEWDTFALLNINAKVLAKIFLLGGFVLFLSCFTMHELVTVHLHQRAEQYRITTFKKGISVQLVNKWLMLQDNLFCYLGNIDYRTNKGHFLKLVYLNQQGSIQKIIQAPSFSCDLKNDLVTIADGFYFNPTTNVQTPIKNKILKLPSLFHHIRASIQAPSLVSMIVTYFQHRQVVAPSVRGGMVSNIMQRLLFYFQIFFYPLLLLCLFLLFEHYALIRWIAVILAYPVVTVLIASSLMISQMNGSTIVFILPIGLVVGIIAFVYRQKMTFS